MYSVDVEEHFIPDQHRVYKNDIYALIVSSYVVEVLSEVDNNDQELPHLPKAGSQPVPQ